MKRFLFSIVLFLGFLFNTGFSIGPEYTTVTSDKDSTTLTVEFQNPRLILSDSRTSEALSNYLVNRDSVISDMSEDLLSIIYNVLGIVEKDQERRYESYMDYLSRKTAIPPDEVKTLLLNNIRFRRYLAAVFAIISIMIITLFIISDIKKIKTANNRMTDMMRLLLIVGTLYILYCSILRMMTPIEMEFIQYLNQLLGC